MSLATIHPTPMTASAARRVAPRVPVLAVAFVALLFVASMVAVGDWVAIRGGIPAQPPRDAPRETLHTAPDPGHASIEIEAAIERLADLGIRRTAICAAEPFTVDASRRHARIGHVTTRSCTGSASDIEATAASIASSGPQALIFDGSTADAHTFIEALRAQGNLAIVVLTSTVDRTRLARTLSPEARKWLMVVEEVPAVERSARRPEPFRLAVLTRNFAVLR